MKISSVKLDWFSSTGNDENRLQVIARGIGHDWVGFIDVDTGCTLCGVCAAVWPVRGVDLDDSAVIDTERCITCCVCIKRLPEGTRTMKPGVVMDASARLLSIYHERKEQKCFV
jgi:NAD-dependent dihydropyrimidine dehydrogenase PreA subunit